MLARFAAREGSRWHAFLQLPSLFWWSCSDRALLTAGWIGVALSALVLAGLANALVLALLFVLYLSVAHVGGVWYGYGWENQLTETGFLAIFLCPLLDPRPFPERPPPVAVIWLFRWLTFRIMLGAGLIKLRGDPCWRDLTCLDYHHETQPMPNPLSWFFHRLPRPLHRVEVLVNHFAQLVVPFGLFCPQPVADVAAALVLITQGWLVLSGNFAWLNLLTLVLAFSGLDDAALRHVLPLRLPPPGPFPLGYAAAVIAVAALILFLSWRPARNLVSRDQIMNTSFDPLHLVNSYGAFGSITRVRHEVVVEGTDALSPGPSSTWREYEFKAKPGDPRRRPPQFAPYHLRLDWLMWFLALGSPGLNWFVPFLNKLLDADRASLRLLRRDPFGGQRPDWVRARVFRYRYSTWREWRATGDWWVREPLGDFVPPISRGG